jgi:hypothetical protein
LPEGSFQFHVDAPAECTSPNPDDCPATFAEAKSRADGNPDGEGPACTYPEGVCGCHVVRAVIIDGTPQQCHWMCRSGEDGDAALDADCPWPRPLAGDPCAGAMECDYTAGCSGAPSLGPSMICQNGHWAQLGGLCLGPETSAP